MVRKITIALAAVAFAGALAASTAADARMGGGGGGGGGRGGGGGGRGGGSFHAAMMGGGMQRSGFVGSRSVAFRSGVSPRFNRVAFARFHRFHHRRFAFASVGFYGDSCWTWQSTPWGWRRVWACDSDY
jgi:hypothetical protein